MTDIAIRGNGTMTHVDPYEPARFDQTAPQVVDPTGGRLVAWAQSMAAAGQLAKALCEASFVPQHFRNKPGDAAAAIMYGDEIGMSPTNSLQNIIVISGRPSLYARTMVALAMKHGHRVWTEASTPDSVTVCGQRRGSSHVERVTWTMARARKAGYTSNKKYDQNPEEMLYSRAAAEVSRKIAPDALLGMPYSAEELELGEASVSVTAQRADVGEKRTAQRKPREAAPVAEAPPLDDVEPPASQPVDEPAPPAESGELITAQQSKLLHVLFAKSTHQAREARLAFASEAVGREVESSSELTKAEASVVIDRLQAAGDQEPEGWR